MLVYMLLCPRATTWRNRLTCFCTCWVLSLLPDGAGAPIHAHSTPAIGHSLIFHVPPMSHFCVLAPDLPVCIPAVPSTGTWWCVHTCPIPASQCESSGIPVRTPVVSQRHHVPPGYTCLLTCHVPEPGHGHLGSPGHIHAVSLCDNLGMPVHACAIFPVPPHRGVGMPVCTQLCSSTTT